MKIELEIYCIMDITNIMNNGTLNKRILREIESGYKSNEFQFMLDADGQYGDKNICYLKFSVKTGTYSDQIHVLKIKFMYDDSQPYVFPKDPPNVTFMTPIFHTNISETGAICLDILNDKWSPFYGIETIFNSIICLLDDPNTNSPFNSLASKLYTQHINNIEAYKTICQKIYREKIKSCDIGNILLNSKEYSLAK